MVKTDLGAVIFFVFEQARHTNAFHQNADSFFRQFLISTRIKVPSEAAPTIFTLNDVRASALEPRAEKLKLKL